MLAVWPSVERARVSEFSEYERGCTATVEEFQLVSSRKRVSALVVARALLRGRPTKLHTVSSLQYDARSGVFALHFTRERRASIGFNLILTFRGTWRATFKTASKDPGSAVEMRAAYPCKFLYRCRIRLVVLLAAAASRPENLVSARVT